MNDGHGVFVTWESREDKAEKFIPLGWGRVVCAEYGDVAVTERRWLEKSSLARLITAIRAPGTWKGSAVRR